jgi:nucleoid-associated protein YgaU
VRTAILLLLLTCAFGSAALWQERKVAQLERERAEALRAAGGAAPLPLEQRLAPGEGVVIVGRPSGAEPVEVSPPQVAAAAAQGEDWERAAAERLGDFELEVRPGQTLSQIAHAHYRSHAPELLRALAAYNGLADPDRVKAGQRLRLPPVEKLTGKSD